MFLLKLKTTFLSPPLLVFLHHQIAEVIPAPEVCDAATFHREAPTAEYKKLLHTNYIAMHDTFFILSFMTSYNMRLF
jgi:hypothetical protein